MIGIGSGMVRRIFPGGLSAFYRTAGKALIADHAQALADDMSARVNARNTVAIIPRGTLLEPGISAILDGRRRLHFLKP